ncbi:hypothetical protein L6452_01673 [Arctium lappa]|uniref:Uncharacterized protein n=1 Tax=Arctium lappa TaxID=4217 RepID=A0ACB9FHA1_ARCLA|nr:hypothetical protein L6452_01673 [Arctium lappa]
MGGGAAVKLGDGRKSAAEEPVVEGVVGEGFEDEEWEEWVSWLDVMLTKCKVGVDTGIEESPASIAY